jgi:hypothetical protein
MKNKLTLFIILFSLSIQISAQEYIIRVQKAGSKRYSYINEKGEDLIKDDFFICTDFSEYGSTIIAHGVSSEYLFMDKNGELIKNETELIPIVNEWSKEVSGFSDGMVRTKINGKIGAINYQGVLTVPTEYKTLSEFYGHHAIGFTGKSYFIIKSNGEKIELEFEKIKGFKHFSEGLAPICLKKNWGFVDTLGQMVIEAKFKSVGYFNGGIAWAKHLNGLVGYIDKTGAWVLEPNYATAMPYDEKSGLARVKSNRGWGYVNLEKEFSDLGITNTFHNFYEGLTIKHDNGKVGFVDHTGAWAIDPVFDAVHKFINGFARAEIDNKWGIIDGEGKWFIEPKYKEIGEVVILNDN